MWREGGCETIAFLVFTIVAIRDITDNVVRVICRPLWYGVTRRGSNIVAGFSRLLLASGTTRCSSEIAVTRGDNTVAGATCLPFAVGAAGSRRAAWGWGRRGAAPCAGEVIAYFSCPCLTLAVGTTRSRRAAWGRRGAAPCTGKFIYFSFVIR